MINHLVFRLTQCLAAVAALFALFASSAVAANPVITIDGVKSQGVNAEILSGTINPSGSGATYTVEYGRTKFYGQATPSLPVSGTGAVPFAVPLPGLQPMSTYHFRISATNGSGTTVTEDELFENLSTWKIEGEDLEDLPEPATFEDEFEGGEGEGGSVEIRDFSLSPPIRFYCQQSSHTSGILDVQYGDLEFNNSCVTYINNMASSACKPIGGITLHLDRFLAQREGTAIHMGEECSIGEDLVFYDGGYSPVSNGKEVVKYQSRISGTTYLEANPAWGNWETSFIPKRSLATGAWLLTGPYAGKAFGVVEG